MLSVLPSVLVLGPALIAALLLARGRSSPPDGLPQRLGAARALSVAIPVQGIHFAEEAFTSFDERLGVLLGLPSMPLVLFLGFNLGWIGIWVASVPGIRSGRTSAFFAAWFLAIAGVANGAAHPLLAVASEGYFPGLVTSPFIGLAALWLAVRLHGATQPRRDNPSGAA